jgi:hypothetical protein
MEMAIVKVSVSDTSRARVLLTSRTLSLLVGDFGLATSSLAAVDPSDVSPHSVIADPEMTLG